MPIDLIKALYNFDNFLKDVKRIIFIIDAP